MKKWIAILLISALLCPLIGCSSTDENTIWVVTEETTWDHMNGQAQMVQMAFEKEHPGVKIRLDILPTGEQERSAYLQQLRTQILQGGGPDAYLLPTDNRLMVGDGTGRRFLTVDPLFADVALAMENGMFRDISQWYDADAQLGKDGLNTTVMNAGVLDGNRYVLPLRYDIPVIYAETQALEEWCFDISALKKPLQELMQAALNTGLPIVAAGGVYKGSSALSNWIDYTSGKISLTEGDLTSYLENYQQVLEFAQDHGKAACLSVTNYVYGYYDKVNTWAVRYPLCIDSLAKLLEYAPVAQYEESEYAILPLQSDNGDTVATVTYYAAMGSGCRNPELTYEFLRQFLLEDSQWEANRPTKMNLIIGDPPSKFTQDKSNQTQYPGLIENGWPVRTKGSLAPLWEVRRKQFYSPLLVSSNKQRMRKIGLNPLQEQWAEILETPIDQVRFPSVMDDALETVLSTLSDPDQAYMSNGISMQSLAQKLLWDMRRHISEG